MPTLIVRHGEAVDQRPDLPDAWRYLTARGRADALQAGALLTKRGLAIDLILTSPFVRALQTAELLAQGAGFRGEFRIARELLPDAEPEVATALVVDPAKLVVMVGHQPHVASLAEALTQRMVDDFPKLGMLLVEGDQMHWLP